MRNWFGLFEFMVLFQAYLSQNHQIDVNGTNSELNKGQIQANHSQNVGTKNPVEFVLPFKDIICENLKYPKLIKTSLGVLMLSEDKIFNLNFTTGEFLFIRRLNGIDGDASKIEASVLDAEILFIISIQDHLHVYRTTTQLDQDPVEPLQKLPIYGRLRQISCFKSKSGFTYLVVASNFTEAHGRLSLLKWNGESFDLEEERNIQPISDVYVLQGGNDDIILTVKYAKRSRAKTSVNAFMITDHRLNRIQTLYIDVDIVHPFVFDGQYYFLSCSRRLKECVTHNMIDEKFDEFQRVSFEGNIPTAAYGRNYIVCERNHEIVTFIHPSMECFGTFTPKHTDLSRIITHDDINGKSYILLCYIRPYSLLVQLIEVKIDKIDWVKDNLHPVFSQDSEFHNIIKGIRNYLLSRKVLATEIREGLNKMRAVMKNKNRTDTQRVEIKSKHLKRIDINNPDIQTPVSIRNKLLGIKANLETVLENVKNSFKENLNVENLYVKNLKYDGALYDGITRTPTNDLIIKVPVESETMVTSWMSLPRSADEREDTEVGDITIDGDVVINDLNVETINEIDWNQFRETLFNRKHDTEIDGSLIFENIVTIQKLETQTINDVPIDSFVTLNTDQEIHSNLYISKFYTSNLTTESVNDIDLGKDVARNNVDNIIEGPVTISHLNVSKNLQLSVGDEDNFARHIIGTKLEDLSQIYHGHITINGSLTIKNLVLDRPDTLILVNGNKMELDIENHYWMKSVDQTFGMVKFINDVVAPKLQIDYFNNHTLSSYLLCNVNPNKIINLSFDSVKIDGSIYLDVDHPSKVSEISRSAVRRNGRTIMKGDVYFQDHVIIDNLVTKSINDIATDQLITHHDEYVKFYGEKKFKSLLVRDELHVIDRLDVVNLNGKSLKEVIDNSLRLDQPLIMNSATFYGEVNVDNLNVNYLNDINLKEFLEHIKVSDNHIHYNGVIKVLGDVSFKKNLQLIELNGIVWDKYVELLVFRNESTRIEGIKKFLKGLHVGKLQIESINQLNISDWYEKSLTKYDEQVITGNWKFENVYIKNLLTDYIDNISITNLIDTTQPITIQSDLLIDNLNVDNTISGEILNEIDLNQIIYRMKHLNLDKIKQLTVMGNVKWLENEQNSYYSSIEYLFKNAVRNGVDQRITGKVTFKDKVYVEQLHSDSNLLNYINVIELAKDCLLKHTENDQIVYGVKHFHNMIVANELVANSYVAAPLVNDVNILEFNSSMYRLSDSHIGQGINGRKVFKNSVIFHTLNAYGGHVNGYETKSIVLQSTHDLLALPSIGIAEFYVRGNFYTHEFNGINFNIFLNRRLRKHGQPQEVFGYLTFEYLHLNHENSDHITVNGIDLRNVIVKNSDSLQEVTGSKIIKGFMKLHGPSHVSYMNGQDLTKKYLETIFLNHKNHLPKLQLTNAIFERGLNVNGTIDGYDVNYFVGIEDKVTDLISNDLLEANHKLSSILNHPVVYNSHLLYLEYDESQRITWNRSIGVYNSRHLLTDDIFSDCLYAGDVDPCKCIDDHCKIVIETTSNHQIYVSQLCGPHDPWRTRIEQGNLYVTIHNDCSGYYTNYLNITWIHSFDNIQNYIYSYPNQVIVDVKLFDFEHNKLTKKYGIVELLSQDKNDILILLLEISSTDNVTVTESVIYDFNLQQRQNNRKNLITKLHSNGEQVTLILSLISFAQSHYYHNDYNSYNSSKLIIYDFDHIKNNFRFVQNIPGYYNIIDMINIDQATKHLVIGCDICSRILVYSKSTRSSDPYLINQIILLSRKLSSLVLFQSVDKDNYMIVTHKNSHSYYLYEFSHLNGWTVRTHGYERGLKHIVPIGASLASGHDYILSIASHNQAKAILLYKC